ncbi:MAG: hypothetical protein ACK5OB_01305 [Pirellula sp.]
MRVLSCVLGLWAMPAVCQAGCGYAPQPMVWRFATSDQLLTWDGNSAVQVTQPRFHATDELSTPCSQCRCPRQDQPRVPLEALPRFTLETLGLVPDQDRVMHPSDPEIPPRVEDESFSTLGLSVLDRPPRLA